MVCSFNPGHSQYCQIKLQIYYFQFDKILLINALCLILSYSYRILIFMYIFGYSFQKGNFKGFSKKRAQRQKNWGELTTTLPPCSRGPAIRLCIDCRELNKKIYQMECQYQEFMTFLTILVVKNISQLLTYPKRTTRAIWTKIHIVSQHLHLAGVYASG